MNFVAVKMLVGDRTKYLGIIMGLTFASLLITQQASIFVGLMARTYGFVSDAALADIWVMDPKVQFIDDLKPLSATQLLRVRGVEGVEWAVPLYKGLLKARLSNGNFQTVNIIGLDDATLIGGPATMLVGELAALRHHDSIIVDALGAADKLATVLPDGTSVPLGVGDTLELNDHRAVVVGLCRVSRTFQSQPVIYTTYTRATRFAPRERKLLSFVLVKARPGVDVQALSARIRQVTGLGAYRRDDFASLTVEYFLKYTGISINFCIAISLGFLVGTAIAGQTFYNFTLENLRHFAMLKAMGTLNSTLLRMILLQAAMTGSIGYGLGVGAASLSGYLLGDTQLAFRMPWQLLVLSAVAVTAICMLAALLSIRKVLWLEPAMVFKG
jgi:putative ABC transport system permease protein